MELAAMPPLEQPTTPVMIKLKEAFAYLLNFTPATIGAAVVVAAGVVATPASVGAAAVGAVA